MERRERPDDERYPRAPVPPHERTWRHPSEVGHAQWQRTEPPAVIGRGLLTSVCVLGSLIAIGVMWAVLTTDPGATARRASGSPLDSFRPLAPPVLDVPGTEAPAPAPTGGPAPTAFGIGAPDTAAPTPTPAPAPTSTSTDGHIRVLATPAPLATEVVDGDRQQGATAPAGIDPDPVPATLQPAIGDATVASSRGPASGNTVPAESIPAGTTTAGTVPAGPLTGDSVVSDQPPSSDPVSETPALAKLSMPTVVVQQGTDDPAVAVPILDGHIALVSGTGVADDGSPVAVTTDDGLTTGKLLLIDANGVAVVSLDEPAPSPVDTGPTPRIGARVRVAVGGEALEGTVIRVGHGEATLEMAECPAGAPVIDRRQRLVGFCIEGGDGDIMLTNAVDELATAVAHDLEPADTTPPTEPDTTTADTTGG